jgi:hypothetical protein
MLVEVQVEEAKCDGIPYPYPYLFGVRVNELAGMVYPYNLLAAYLSHLYLYHPSLWTSPREIDHTSPSLAPAHGHPRLFPYP